MDRYSEYLLGLVLVSCFSSNEALLRGSWSAWSTCSSSCNGKQERTRTCDASPGESCDGLTTESRTCTDQCITTSVILCIVLGLLVLLALILVIFLIIRRCKAMKENEKTQFNVNAAEDYYDRSIKGASFTRPHATASSIASSRATIPTIAPYLPDLDEEGSRTHLNEAYDDSDSLDKVSLSESIQEVKIDFDVETEVAHENSPSPKIPKVTMMTFAGTQTEVDEDEYDDDDLEVHVDIV